MKLRSRHSVDQVLWHDTNTILPYMAVYFEGEIHTMQDLTWLYQEYVARIYVRLL